MSPAIRAATPADLVAVTAIYDHAVRHGTASFELAPPDAPEMARRRQALVDASYPYLVAEIDGAWDESPMTAIICRKPDCSASAMRRPSNAAPTPRRCMRGAT